MGVDSVGKYRHRRLYIDIGWHSARHRDKGTGLLVLPLGLLVGIGDLIGLLVLLCA